jgi:hypothetical protein
VIGFLSRARPNGVTSTRSTSIVVLAILLMGAAVAAGHAAEGGRAALGAAPAVGPVLAVQPQSNEMRFTLHTAVLAVLICGVLIGITLARKGHALPIRDIAGLSAFDEAVARATEMGRPTFFTTGGVCDIRRVQLYASMPLLRRVAQLSGELGNRMIVSVAYPETLPVHTNAMREGYADAGAIEEYRPDDLRYFPGGQFFFAMATMGWLLRERPAACFYFGWWEADALMLAETGQTIGALQIAGTDQLPQIPFFVAACDYTIIGEEFWACSAKMSQDPDLLGSFGAQDLFKLLMLMVILVGVLLCQHDGFARWMESVRDVLG